MDENNDLTVQNSEEAEKEPKKDQSVFYWIRLFIGGYLIYLAWQLFSGILAGTAAGTTLVVCAIASGLFLLAGIGLIVWSLWLLSGRK